ncbi:MAG: twin-arginine translocase TatA/TatE family subunit [Myxococcota bacterium]
MFGIGTGELLIIFAIVLLLFGGRRLPEVASGLGQAIRNFRQSVREQDAAAQSGSKSDAPPTAQSS